jgi:hypothetical protein
MYVYRVCANECVRVWLVLGNGVVTQRHPTIHTRFINTSLVTRHVGCVCAGVEFRLEVIHLTLTFVVFSVRCFS